MKKYLAVVAALMVGATAMAQQAFPSYVNVTGKTEREVTPNEIYVGITIDETTSKGKVSVAEQEKKMIAALKKIGINTDKDLQVENMSGDLQEYILKKSKTLTSKKYSLKVNDANTLSKVFAALADINISKAAVTKATRSDMEQIRMEMRGEAVKNAKANAEALAGALDQTVGKAFLITEYNYNEPVMYRMEAMPLAKGAAMADYDDSGAASLEFKSMKVTHSVNVQFVLE